VWKISGNLSAMATGLQHDVSGSSGSFDYVQSTGESWIDVAGTGVAPGPYDTSNFALVSGVIHPQVVYGIHYATQGGYDLPPTIDHFEGEPPAIIPVSFEIIPEQEKLVFWNFNVASATSVQNKDLGMSNGFARASSQFSHTMAWGGITSVIDKNTGQPVTDWTLDSASGFDYSQPFVEAPEPSSILLALCAVSGVTFRRAKLRRSCA
jgi:hypothetical protein